MSVYTIADLHLSFNENKPMDIFGDIWNKHEEKIRKNWIENVRKEDWVVLPGDFSWSMKLEDTYKDLEYLENLPGTKILLKGNHDYWWSTITKMNQFIKDSNFKTINFLQNNSYEIENAIIAGTRGWVINDIENEKIINRELERLKLSLQDAKSRAEKSENEKEIIVFMHYPPVTYQAINSLEILKFVEIMKQYNVKRCYYGHLHSDSIKTAVEGTIQGVELKLVSSDYLNFAPIKVI